MASVVRAFRFLRPPSQSVTCLPDMAMRDELTAILAAAEVPKEFTEYLVNKGLFQVDQLALMAGDENRLEDKIFPILTAANIKMDDLMTQIAVKKAWNLARTAMNTSMKVHTGATTATDILPHPTRENIVQTWKRTHSFTLSGERLLTEQLIKTLHSELKAEPPKLSIYFL